MNEGKAFVGTSGWSYPHWGKGVFYPVGVKQKEWLSYYSNHFDTVEVNNTFYQLPPKTVFERWERSVPSHFSFVVKVSRYITHIKRLNQPEQPLSKLLENASFLKGKLTLLLFQLPPLLTLNRVRLTHLLDLLENQSVIPDIRTTFEFRNSVDLIPNIRPQAIC